MENITLNKVILHILDVNNDEPILSSQEMVIEHHVHEFLSKHITKLSNDGDLKKTHPLSAGSDLLSLCGQLHKNEDLFGEITRKLASDLFALMKQNSSIPSADVILCLFKAEGRKYFALLKLNYRSSYIHFVANSDDGIVNKLVKQKTTLPGEAQKIDEGIIVDLADLRIELLEKQYEINGKRECYLSKYFLKCDTELSHRQKIKILDVAASKISKKYFDEDFEKVSQARSCMAEGLEETGEINVNEVANRVFGTVSSIKDAYVEAVKKAGLVEETIVIPETVNTGKKLKTQKLQTDSGIEINFPSHYYNNPDLLQFINNPDGTISILIKNVGKVVNK